ncbi:MAG: hypothetical protein H5U20_08025, partial [Rhodobacteraceae bacterium]|nr:hypothetical protein [Paracoccaceae bacterium]
VPDVTDGELRALYDCIVNGEQSADAGSDGASVILANWSDGNVEAAGDFATWTNFAATPYVSFTHGERFANNHVNAIGAEAYGKFEDIDSFPVGGVIAKPTFSIWPDGQAYLETLFVMEKVAAGTSPDTNDWIYTSVGADGAVLMQTGGAVDGTVEGCAACHMAMGGEHEDLAFIPPEYRAE